MNEQDHMRHRRFDERVAQRVEEGLPGHWYVVAKSVQVRPDRPLGVKALGRRFVLWRNMDGALQCLEDLCPHRGALLSRGETVDGNIACRYHGVRVDGSGTIVKVPAAPGCPLEGRKRTTAFHVLEKNDGVFVYVPSAEHPEPPALVFPAEFDDPSWSSLLCSVTWRCNYQLVLENNADPMHGSYLHADSFTLAYGSKEDTMQIEPAGSGFLIKRVGQSGLNFDWTHVAIDASAPHVRLDIPYPAAAGPGGPFRILGFFTPVDETATRVYLWRNRQVSGLARESWRFLFRAALEERHWNVLEQDRIMLEDIRGSEARARETLYQHDVGVTRVRKILTAKAREQVRFEDNLLSHAQN